MRTAFGTVIEPATAMSLGDLNVFLEVIRQIVHPGCPFVAVFMATPAVPGARAQAQDWGERSTARSESGSTAPLPYEADEKRAALLCIFNTESHDLLVLPLLLLLWLQVHFGPGAHALTTASVSPHRRSTGAK